MRKIRVGICGLTTLILFFAQDGNAQTLSKGFKDSLLKDGLQLYKMMRFAELTSNEMMDRFRLVEFSGSLTYIQNKVYKSIFFDEDESKYWVEKTFYGVPDSSPDSIKVDHKVRRPTKDEKYLIDVRSKTYETLRGDTSYFKKYKGYKFNLVLMDHDNYVDVYIFTGNKREENMPLGNDYILTFDQKVRIIGKKKIHSGLFLVPMTSASQIAGRKAAQLTILDAEDEAVPYITSTDICTALMHKEKVDWDIFEIVTTKYTSRLDTKKVTLEITPVGKK